MILRIWRPPPKAFGAARRPTIPECISRLQKIKRPAVRPCALRNPPVNQPKDQQSNSQLAHTHFARTFVGANRPAGPGPHDSINGPAIIAGAGKSALQLSDP
jgi:hypothetical protein